MEVSYLIQARRVGSDYRIDSHDDVLPALHEALTRTLHHSDIEETAALIALAIYFLEEL